MRWTGIAAILGILLIAANLWLSRAVLHQLSALVSYTRRAVSPQFQAPARTLADLRTFEATPNEKTLLPLEKDMAAAPLEPVVVQRLVVLLANHDLSSRLVNAIVVDLARYDTTNTLRWLHEVNVVGRINPTSDGPAVVRRTAHACWLVLALRANFARNGIDLTRMDLRDDAPFVGQSMNLSNIDFSSSILSPGNWQRSNLTTSGFANVDVAGALTCTQCTYHGKKIVGKALLQDGHWVIPAGPGKAPARVD